MCADIHDGPEHMLQSEAGYIDARPLTPARQNLLQRAAGPYIRVKRRNSRCEQMFSAILPAADIQPCHRQGMSKAYRVTLQIPACVTVSATARPARLDPAVNGTMPSAPATKCWTIPCGRMRSPSPSGST